MRTSAGPAASTGACPEVMRTFQPFQVPARRLARLGVVLDVDGPLERLRGLAILCDRAGMDAVWLASRAAIDRPGAWPDPRPAAALVGGELARARLGVLVGAGPTPDVAGADSAVDLAAADLPASVAEVVLPAAAAMRRLRADTLVRISAYVEDLVSLRPLLRVVDDVVLPGWRFPDLETAADEVRAEAQEAGRDPTTLGVAALVTVSIGRTRAEAEARAESDEVFGRLGDARLTGIFGTLEECQDRVIALAHAGINDLRCLLPASDDVHDVIAQLTAVTLGSTDVLIPGSLRSPAPPPPEGWGGRPDVPPSPGISAGSRRR